MIYLLFLENNWMQLWGAIIALQIAALVLDLILGEPKYLHPLVGFGKIISVAEKLTWSNHHGNNQKLRGLLGWSLAVIPLSAFFCLVLLLAYQFSPLAFWALNLIVLYLTLGLKSLSQHAHWVAQPLISGDADIETARTKVSWLVSRDTEHLSTSQINKACIESVLENGNDAVFGALFWFYIAGAPGALIYRLANTLDARWGYRSDRYIKFGWWAARMDDWMNLIPARICALAYSFSGNWQRALSCWNRTAHWRHYEGRGFASPNSGIVMSSGAGAMNISLGGDAFYHGEKVIKPPLGEGAEPKVEDILKSVQILKRSLVLFMLAQTLIFATYSMITSVFLWLPNSP